MNKKFDISDVIEYIAGVLEPDAATAFEQALTEDSILKSQYDEMLVYSENIKHNFGLSANVDYNLVDFINDSDSPRIGDIYSLLNVDVSGVIIDSDENFYRIMPLSTYTTFAEQYDIVFTGKGFKKGNGVAHTHLAVALDKSELGVKRGKLDNDLLKALQHADSGNPVELPAGVTFGEGVDELLLDNYDEWVEDLRDELYALSEKGLQAAEGKEATVYNIISVDKTVWDKITDLINREPVLAFAAATTTVQGVFESKAVTLFRDDNIVLRMKLDSNKAPEFYFNFAAENTAILKLKIMAGEVVLMEKANITVEGHEHYEFIDSGIKITSAFAEELSIYLITNTFELNRLFNFKLDK